MSTENKCIQLRPSPVCGYRGSCLNATTCVCESGWGKSTEMAVYLKGVSSTISDENLVCDTNETLLTVLYGIALAGIFWASYKHLIRIRKPKHAIRLIPLLSSYFCAIMCISIRLIDHSRYLAQDSPFTFFYCMCWFLANSSSLIFYNRFVEYQAKSSHVAKLNGVSSRIRVDILKVVQWGVLFVDSVIWSLILSTGFIDSFEQDEAILKSAFAIYVVRNLYAAWADVYYIGALVHDCRQVLSNMPGSLSGLSRVVAPTGLTETLKTKTIPGLLYLRNLTFAFNMFVIWFHLLPLFWDLWWNAFKYFIPIKMLVGVIMNVEVIDATARARTKENSKKTEGETEKATSGKPNSTVAFDASAYEASHITSDLDHVITEADI
uniref:Uncharacterized protein n=1 Tax=Aplanochytrium stocchinoi TaxID=215587 RepID=A0A7S3LRW1_9STRA|mmetsp:Transcript_20109/g.25693  ORF Transcript_20109/g.25693 Transcript_20109/m.25693 type:complete len:379 (-) Transcript_20109:193-1329(-)